MSSANVDKMFCCCYVAAQTENDCHGILCVVLGPVVAGADSQLRKLSVHMARPDAHAGNSSPPHCQPLASCWVRGFCDIVESYLKSLIC